MNRARNFVSIMLIVAVLAGCTPVVGEATPEPSPAAQQATQQATQATTFECTDTVTNTTGLIPYLEEGQANFSLDTLLLTGLDADISRVIGQANEVSSHLFTYQNEAPLWVANVGGDDGVDGETLSGLFGTSPQGDITQQGALTSRSVTIQVNEDVTDSQFGGNEQAVTVAAAIQLLSVSNQQFGDKKLVLPVFAELNPSTSLVETETEFDTNGVGAHPCGELSTGGSLAMNEFWSQWALSDTAASAGISLFDAGGSPASASPSQALGSHRGCVAGGPGSTPNVFVFDTSPFGASTMATVPLASECTPSLDLEVSSAIAIAGGPANHLSQHGLFAATLAYAVAPQASYHLDQVLDNQGGGKLKDLLLAMGRRYAEVKQTGVPAVFNLSLGVNPPNLTLDDSDWENIKNAIGVDDPKAQNPMPAPVLETDIDPAPPFGTDTFLPRVALEALIRVATNAGIIIVAAAGNDKEQPEQYPAVYKLVLGVAASSREAGHACYSNHGDLYAPGGDLAPLAGGPCLATAVPDCTGDACKRFILSVIQDGGAFKLAYWAGTSFATPLVSGIVAKQLYDVTTASSLTSNVVQNFVHDMQQDGCTQVSGGQCIADLTKAASFPP